MFILWKSGNQDRPINPTLNEKRQRVDGKVQLGRNPQHQEGEGRGCQPAGSVGGSIHRLWGRGDVPLALDGEIETSRDRRMGEHTIQINSTTNSVHNAHSSHLYKQKERQRNRWKGKEAVFHVYEHSFIFDHRDRQGGIWQSTNKRSERGI